MLTVRGKPALPSVGQKRLNALKQTTDRLGEACIARRQMRTLYREARGVLVGEKKQ